MLISVIFFSNNYFPLSILLLLYVNFLFLALRFFVFSHFHFLQQIGLLTLPILYHANHIDLLMVFYIHYISQMCFFDFLLLPKLSLLLTLVHIFLLPYFYPFTFLLGLTIFFWSSLWGALLKPRSDSRYLYAEHHLHSNQVSCKLIKRRTTHSPFRCSLPISTRSSVVHLRSPF
ncbi:hypothetical protein wVul_0541 [Wolbachia endosymbiont of Armadillidium vulgare str. wVulC]|nr:hypothetical protein wVul_0541 [Wolbachia endosymbiont of Armadillidium vulgare str. wVulC]